MIDNIPRICSNRFLRFAEQLYMMHVLGYTANCQPWAVQVIHRLGAKYVYQESC